MRSDGHRDEGEDYARPLDGGKGWIKDLRNTALTANAKSLWDDHESLFNDDVEDGKVEGGGDGPTSTTPTMGLGTSALATYSCQSCAGRPHTRPPCIALACGTMSLDCRNMICRVTIIAFMIVTITFTCLDLLILHRYLHVWLDSILAWLSVNPVSGGIAFISIFVVGSLCFFPVVLITLGAGYAYAHNALCF